MKYLLLALLEVGSTHPHLYLYNIVWNKLISENKLYGCESSQKFYHLNTEDMYNKISNLNIID